MKSVLLKGLNLVLPDRKLLNGSVLIEGDKIKGILADKDAFQAEHQIEIPDLTLFPGFIDVHIHGSVGVDLMEATASDLQTVSTFLVSQGVTSWLPTLVPAEDDNYASAVGAITQAMAAKLAGARVVGVHYEGPFVNALQCGALHSDYFKTYSTPADVDRFPTPPGLEAVRMITLAPEITGGVELVRELKSRGWVIAIGHTRADLQVLDQACEAGARHMTHFMNAMTPLHHRKPGPIAWGLSRDEVTFDVIADGIHLDPFMLRLLLKVKGSHGISLISDAIAAAGKGEGEYQIWGEIITVKERRTSNSSGNIAGSVTTMLDAVLMMRSLGVSDLEIARMSATNPARLLRLDHICGSIEEGKRADLVALDQKGEVRLTIVGGDVVFQA